MVRIISLFAILFAQAFPLKSYAENLYEVLDIKSNFTLRVSEPIPTEYVFTEGANGPKFEPYGVAAFRVADIDQDTCDDVILDWQDSLSPIQVFYGDKDGTLKRLDPFTNKVNFRSVRQFEVKDLNQDGILDLVGFTAPHGWQQSKLGRLWDANEPEFIALSINSREYTILNNKLETYSHTGLLADVNNDGEINIVQIEEDPAEGIEIKLNGASASDAPAKKMLKLSRYAVYHGETGFLNNDNFVDTILTLSKSHKRHPIVTPEDATEVGTIALFLGKSKTELSQIKPKIFGRHWMDGITWRKFLSTKTKEAQKQAYAGTSNVELLDLDQDGDLDILVGYFVQANSRWVTSGMQIFENKSGLFKDATIKFMPYQPANKNLTKPTGLMYEASLADLNKDGKNDLILGLRSLDSETNSRYSSVFYLFKESKFVPVKNEEKLLGDTQKMSLIQSGDFNCDGKKDLVGLFHGIPDKENHYLKTLIAK